MTSDNTRRPNPVDAHVGRRLRVRRVLCGMSQTALADQLGITFQQLQKYESAANRVSASRLWEISNILEVPIEWFFMDIDVDGGNMKEFRTKRETLELVRSMALCSPEVRHGFRALLRAIAEPAEGAVENQTSKSDEALNSVDG
jgi:transcriptional regulator with XRE-family HTH domain